MYKVAIVILNWNGKNLLEKFLPSVIRYSTDNGSVVIIADNGSDDDSINFLSKHHPEVEIIRLDKNYGFTGGYNRALKQVEAEYYLLLNSDVEVTQHWLTPLVDYLDSNADAAVCMPKILSYNQKDTFEYAGAAGGFIDKYGYPFCRGRILNMLEKDNGQYNNTQEIFWASGACMLIRSAIFQQLSGFDESFFAHMEEIDLCWRVKRLGYKIACIPLSTVYHLGGGTLSYNNPRKLYYNHRNNLYMLHKNLPQKLLKKRILSRLLLDGLSGVIYLFTFRFGALKALLKAHKDYRRHKPILYEQRKQLPQLELTDNIAGLYPRSIVLKFFCKRKQLYFTQLKFNK